MKTKTLFESSKPTVIFEDIKEEKKKSDLFEFLGTMFRSPKKFNEFTDYERGRYFFMTNRFMSIKFPLQAQVFNHLKINTGAAVGVWGRMLQPIYKNIPPWVWSGLKKTKSKKEKKVNIKEETKMYYAEKYKIGLKDVEYMIDYFGNDFIQELRELEKGLEIK